MYRDLLYNIDQQDALFTFIFTPITFTFTEQAGCSPSEGTILYTQQLQYVMRVPWLAASRIGVKFKVNSASGCSI
jgi:hypothetical protein